jgi:predicted GNAT family N-acyltransferase
MEGVEDRAADVREPFPGGVVIANPRFSSVYSLNFVRIDPKRPPASAAEAAAIAERYQAPFGLGHRRILVNDGALGESLVAGFKEEGWLADRLIVMALRDDIPASSRPGALDAQEYAESEIAEARRRYYGWPTRWTDSNLSSAVVHQLVAAREVTAGAVHVRNYAAALDGELAAFCDLYSDGTIAQIEDVGTIEPFRKRGLSTAVVRKAMEVAVGEKHELVFLVADADDWPKDFYSRLGFVEIGSIYEFTLLPDKPGQAANGPPQPT